MKKLLVSLVVILSVLSFAEIINLSPGRFVALFFDGKELKLVSQKDDLLPDIAKEALRQTPSLWRYKLEETFYQLMKVPIKIEGNAFPAFGDLNGDGLVDMVIGGARSVEYYENHGSKFEPVWIKKEIGITFDGTDSALDVGDLTGDGLLDIVIVNKDGKISLYLNKGTKESPKFEKVDLEIKGVPKESVPRIYDLDEDGRNDLIIGGGNGEIYFYDNVATDNALGFELKKQDAGKGGYKGFFSLWPKPNGSTGIIDAGEKLAPTFGDINGDGLVDMIVGNEKGEVVYFKNVGKKGNPSWKMEKVETLEWIKVKGRAIPYLVDLDGDERLDLVIGSEDGKVYYALNTSHGDDVAFRVWKSEADKSWLARFLWGRAYWNDLEEFSAIDPNSKYVEIYANLIINADEKIKDEVAYIISHDFIKVLKKFADEGYTDVYLRIPRAIYEIAPKLKYVKLVEKGEYTTIAQRTKEGEWVELRLDIYYEYIVMPNRYLAYFPGTTPIYEGKVYNEFFPYDKTYGKSLLEVVKDADNVWDAVFAISRWLAYDVKMDWRRGKKPRGWYNIYKNLRNKDAGIWCGEFSIIVEAMARSVLIPTTIVLALGEDHQFNQFYYKDGWVHWDQTGKDKQIGRIPKWYQYEQGRFSWVMSWEQNGRYDYVHHNGVVYKAPDKVMTLVVNVFDKDGKPIDGARIILWSHWTLENNYISIPLPGAISYTNENGEAVIENLSTKTYTIEVLTPVGIKLITKKFTVPAIHNLVVVMDESMPVDVEKVSISKIPTVVPYGDHKARIKVLNSTLKTLNWLYTHGIVYREKEGGNVDVYLLDEENYEKFLKGEKFEPILMLSAFDDEIPLIYNTYLVISNRSRAHTYLRISVEKEK